MNQNTRAPKLHHVIHDTSKIGFYITYNIFKIIKTSQLLIINIKGIV
jgi:hypothetical protein